MRAYTLLRNVHAPSPGEARQNQQAPDRMAIYRFSAQMISRSAGRSAVAASAYRSGQELACERTGEVHDYSRKGGVVHSEIMAPDGAPEWATDRARLWNEVEAAEKRKDAQLAREVEIALPRELTREQQIDLTREFVREQFVSKGMVADIAIHEPKASDGDRQPHAHVMLTTRQIGPEGFGAKAREWNDRAQVEGWREAWANHANRALERAGHEQRIDHRSLDAQRQDAMARGDERRAQDLDREPQPKLGPTAAAMERQGIQTDRGDQLRGVQARNIERQGLWQQVREWGGQIREQAAAKLRELAEQASQVKRDLAARLHQADTTRLRETNLQATLGRADTKGLREQEQGIRQERQKGREGQRQERTPDRQQERQERPQKGPRISRGPDYGHSR